MTEKEKMQKQLLYDANDTELVQERSLCKDICAQYNQLPYSAMTQRTELIKGLLGKIGDSVCIEQPFWCDYGYRITVGENFYMNHGGVILDAGGVTFGDHVFIGPQCGFHTAGHPLVSEERNKYLEYAYPITVGSNVWIGAGVQVTPGVTIGDNCVIGAGSVVTKDIPAGYVAYGNPCKPIRPITEQDLMIPYFSL